MNLAMFGGFGRIPPSPGWRRDLAVAILGGGELDLTHAEPADGAQLTAIAFLGGIDVKVPEGARVSMSGLSLLGGRDVKVEPGDGPPSASAPSRCSAACPSRRAPLRRPWGRARRRRRPGPPARGG